MDVEALGQLIRSFFHTLFASRLTTHLEEELLRLRSDYETRLQERDRVIAELRERNVALESKVDRYELVLIPLTSPAANLLSPKPPRPTLEVTSEPRPMSWNEVQADYYEQQAAEIAEEKRHGISNQGR